ncbi:hypothetical protein FACS1894152_7590 [Bacilli bacterium]|nr:hypothetical protein FACS1894152_7590 [Bacilli bacterium]
MMNVFVLSFFLLLLAKDVFAGAVVCPLCTVMIASGLGISRFFGVSNCVVALWFGAILLAIAHTTVTFLEKKGVNNKYAHFTVHILTYAMIVPLYIGKNPTMIFNIKTILGIDEFLFSTLLGYGTLFMSSKLYQYMKKKNGKPHFQFEKVVLPISSLIFLSILLNYAGR